MVTETCPQCGGLIKRVGKQTLHRFKNDYNRCVAIAFAKAEAATKTGEL